MADMKLVGSGRFESGGFFGLRAVFLHPFTPRSFSFLCNKEKMQLAETTFIPVFPLHFQPADIHPRSRRPSQHPAVTGIEMIVPDLTQINLLV